MVAKAVHRDEAKRRRGGHGVERMLHGERSGSWWRKPYTESKRSGDEVGMGWSECCMAKALHRDSDKMTIPPKSDIIIPDAEIPPGGKSFQPVFES